MSIKLCRAKIHRVTVTDSNLDYEGSITIGRDLMIASGINPFELVHVNNLDNGKHWETYVIPGNNTEIILNGSPAHFFKTGHLVTIMAFAQLSEDELKTFYQTVVKVKPYINEVLAVEKKILSEMMLTYML